MTTKTTKKTAAALPWFEFNSDAQAVTALDRKHKFVINIGGLSSGKTATHPIWALLRGRSDVHRLHGIFTNTEKQLKHGVLDTMNARLASWGIGAQSGHLPPREWRERWAREGIPIPSVTDYRSIWYTSEGLHAMFGTLSGTNFKQFETIDFYTIRVEEIPNISRAALDVVMARARCGDHCDSSHGHQIHLFGNPPVGSHPWLFDWLDTLEESAKPLYDGPTLEHRNWPLLRQGIGDAILIRSRTRDNVKNVGAAYESALRASFSAATARARLEGELVRETQGGCYDSFSSANVRDVAYDPFRTLYVCMDINIDTRAAVLAHPLKSGEYPSEWEQPGIEQIGVFGEFFSIGGMNDRTFADAMVVGGRGVGDAGYRDTQLRGLPENWRGLGQHRGPIIAYGDATGNQRSAQAENNESSWQIIDKIWRGLNDLAVGRRYGRDVPDSNPPVRARIDAVNAKFMSAADKPSLVIAPRCRQTLIDCETVVWDDKGLAERQWRRPAAEALRTHCMAGLGYMVHRRAPFGIDAADHNLLKIIKQPRTEWPTHL